MPATDPAGRDPAPTRPASRLKRLYWLLRERDARTVVHRLQDRAIVAAAFVWRRLLFRTRFIVVTGSFGKTTTKELIAAILARQYRVVRTPGNWNHRKFKGPEMTILRARPWHRFVVMEIGAEKPGNMESAARYVRPDMVVVTNVQHAHTKSFSTLEEIAREKSQLLRHLRAGGCAIVNLDNARLALEAAPSGTRIVLFGQDAQSDVRLLQADSRWPERLTLTVRAGDRDWPIDTRLLGTHWTPAVLAALATASCCGIPYADAIAAIGTMEPFWSRMQPVHLEAYGATVIREDGHGQLESLEAALQFLAEARAVRKILVISDFSDANLRTPARAKLIGGMAARIADLAIFVGPLAHRASRAAVEQGLAAENGHACATVAAATDRLRELLRSGDLVLIKGVQSHHLSRIYLGLIGEVRCTLETCRKQIGCDNCPQLGFAWRPELAGLMSPPGSYV